MSAADTNLESLKDSFFAVYEVVRTETPNRHKRYVLSDNKQHIEVLDEEWIILKTIRKEEIHGKLHNIFSQILKNKDSSFTIPDAVEAMDLLLCKQIKSSSTNKHDIKIVMDWLDQRKIESGFSIKSKLSSTATLLNAWKTTNFIFEIIWLTISPEAINTLKGTQKKLAAIEEYWGILKFVKMSNDTFHENLMYFETTFPQILADMLLEFYTWKLSKLTDITSLVAKKHNKNENIYILKMKLLLEAIALGMVPGTPRDGHLSTTGWYLIVKKSGDILCYHYADKEKFLTYLFHHTRFETASSSRHDFGNIYEKDWKQFINLNLQIRFT